MISPITLADDGYEENDISSEAKTLSEGFYSNLNCSDNDWFQVDVPSDTTINITITFDGSTYDIDMDLYDSSMNNVDGSYGTSDSEQVEYYTSSGERCYIEIYPFDIPLNGLMYDMEIEFLSGTQTETITVTSPTASDNWVGGNSYDITWDWTGSFSNVNIELYNESMSYITNIVSGTSNDGNHEWIVPTDIPTDSYQIVVADSNDYDPYDFSDLFTITNDLNQHHPALINGSVNPEMGGDQSTQFTFTVNFTDLDDMAPQYVNISINGTYYEMQKQNPGDVDYLDGCIYEYTTYLQPGEYNYSFGCFDGVYHNSTKVYTGLTVSEVNTQAPTLKQGMVTPPEGEAGIENFVFSVNYSDSENNAPEEVVLTFNGENYTMQKSNPSDNNYMDGCDYIYSLSINETGNYEYNYTAYDGIVYVFDGSYTNLNVVDNTGPLFEYISGTTSGPSGTVFNFTVELFDASGIDEVNGSVQDSTKTEIENLTFYNDGTHNDGAADDMIYGASWNSSGQDDGIYFLDINATDTASTPNYNEYENYTFSIINWSCRLGEEYRWNITEYIMPEMIGCKQIYRVHEINVTSFDSSTVWCNSSIFNKTTMQEEDSGVRNVQSFNFSSNLYEDISGPGGLSFLRMPIKWETVNESLYKSMDSDTSQNITHSELHEFNNTIIYELENPMGSGIAFFHWNNDGILNFTKYVIGGVMYIHLKLLGPDTTPPRFIDGKVIPEIEVIGTPFNITAQVHDGWGIKEVKANIMDPNLNSEELLMHDDGQHNDQEANDGIYGLSWDSNGKAFGVYNISINATDVNNNWQYFEDVLQFEVAENDNFYPTLLECTVDRKADFVGSTGNFNITAEFYDPSGISSASAIVKDNLGNIIATIPLSDDGNHNDGNAGDNLYGAFWNPGTNGKGEYHIDIACEDGNSNSHTYTDELQIALTDWNLKTDYILEYRVTKNTFDGNAFPSFQRMPQNSLHKVHIVDINKTNIGSGTSATVWGKVSHSNDTISWTDYSSLSPLVQLSYFSDIYQNNLFFGSANPYITPLMPTEINEANLEWLGNTIIKMYYGSYIESTCNQTALTFYSDLMIFDSITKFDQSSGYMDSYTFKYEGDEFKMELVSYGPKSEAGNGEKDDEGDEDDDLPAIPVFPLPILLVMIFSVSIYSYRQFRKIKNKN